MLRIEVDAFSSEVVALVAYGYKVLDIIFAAL
jgi:hypothetical protein